MDIKVQMQRQQQILQGLEPGGELVIQLSPDELTESERQKLARCVDDSDELRDPYSRQRLQVEVLTADALFDAVEQAEARARKKMDKWLAKEHRPYEGHSSDTELERIAEHYRGSEYREIMQQLRHRLEAKRAGEERQQRQKSIKRAEELLEKPVTSLSDFELHRLSDGNWNHLSISFGRLPEEQQKQLQQLRGPCDDEIARRRAEKEQERTDWLTENRHRLTAHKIEAGYDCTALERRAVTDYLLQYLKNAGRLDARVSQEFPETVQERVSPGDEAFLAAEQIRRSDAVDDASVVWCGDNLLRYEAVEVTARGPYKLAPETKVYLRYPEFDK